MNDLVNYKVKHIAHEYYQRYIKDGVESASVWLQANLPEELIQDFLDIQKETSKRYGLK